MTYVFKYKLSQKSSLAAIAKAVRALGLNMTVEKDRVSFSNRPGEKYEYKFMIIERVPEWLNERLEAEGLLNPQND